MFAANARVHAQAALRPCAVEGEPARCGTLSVPEDHSAPHGRQLALSVVVLGRSGSGERREPIFVLAGGPGQAATSLLRWAAAAFQSVRRTRDIVLMDQRGSGGPGRLDCTLAPRTFFVPADGERCVARLSQSATLSLYGTESFVEDLELARKALGYDRIVVYGASYGTRAAYVYARRYTGTVRAVVLTAPAPMSMRILDSFAEDGRRALDAVVADCLADSACSRAFPHLGDDVDQFRATVSDSYRVLGLQLLQYSTATAVHIPGLISRAAAGDTAPLDSAIARVREQLAGQLALGLHLSVICAEDLPFGETSQPSALRQQYLRACRGWPKPAVSPRFRDPVRLALPALILVGEWDPVTSPRWASAAAEQFSASQVVTLPRTAHVPDGLEACMGELITRFLDRGAADTSCISTVGRRPYVLR
jgi:pimeloyl-ACP methyl ester carboxylesterase